MSSHFFMGAINKTTNKYEYPKIANKKNKYKCPSCENDVIFRCGRIKQPHYAHYKSTNPCLYYNKPNETQIHKDAKLLLKTILDNKNKLCFTRECSNCFLEEPSVYIYNISEIDYNENTKATIEHKFFYNNSNNRRADVALVEKNDIKYIFEIKHKNPTKEEDRPEPWFEINASKLINSVNSYNVNENGEIMIECIRKHRCKYCKEQDHYDYEIIKKLQMKEEEQRREHNELRNMTNEDERTIQNENEMIKKIQMKEDERRKENDELIKMTSEDERTIQNKNEIQRKLKMKKEEEETIQHKKQLLRQMINNKTHMCKKYEKTIQMEKLEDEILEKEKIQDEMLEKEQLEQKKLEKRILEYDYIKVSCKCGLMFIEICNCNNPKYELNRINKENWCANCKKWKDRC